MISIVPIVHSFTVMAYLRNRSEEFGAIFGTR